jgi:hypothetical protein
MTPLTDNEKRLIAKNVLAACKDIEKLNSRGYKFLHLCSGFIAHYNINGFKAYYSTHSLKADIERYARQNQWSNFRKGDTNADYYHSKRDAYNMILGHFVAQQALDAQYSEAVKFLRDHVQWVTV